MTSYDPSEYEAIETNGDAEEAAEEQDIPSFEELGMHPQLLEAIAELGWEAPTDVQAASIPPGIEGRDLLVQARTGSGKTGAFVLPILQSTIDRELHKPQALVLCPTRELALQVATEADKLASRSPIKTMAIYGGAAIGPQIRDLEEGAQFIAGTPGRVLDHLRRRTFKPDDVKALVLDEADEMLSMGFLEEINAIIERLPEKRQMMLFSATIPADMERMIDRYQNDPVALKLSEDFVGVREIDHVYYMISGGDRQQDLLRVLDYESPTSAIIFCNTRSDTAGVANFLAHQGFAAEGISSDLSQRDRERAMGRMREGKTRFLVATDIAARGIDISDVSHVINYAFPESADVYVHRTGRTGRAGKSGIAISLVSPREIGSFYYLRLIHKIHPEERFMPSPEELAARRDAELYEKLADRYEGREVTEAMRRLARRVWSTPEGEGLIGQALLELLDKPAPPKPKPAPARRRRSESSDDDERGDGDGDGRRRERSRGRGRGRDGDDRDDRRGGRDRNDRGGRSRGRGGERRERDGGGDRGGERGGRGGEPGGERGGRGDEGASEERAPRRRRSRESFTTSDGEVEYYETIDMSEEAAANHGAATEPRADEAANDDARSSSEGGRRERSRSRSSSDNHEDQPGMTRLYLSVGRKHGLRTGELVDYLKTEGGLEGEQVGKISMRDRHTFVNVESEAADAVIEKLSGQELKERALRIEPARG